MPAPLLALALRLGITKAAQIVKDKGYKFLQRKVNKALKSKTKQKESAEKAYKGKGSKRQKGKVTQRKKAKVDSGLSIKKNPKHGSIKQQENTIRRQRIKEEHTKRNLKEKIKAGNLSKKEAIQIAKEQATSSKLSIKDKWNLRSKIPRKWSGN